MQGRAESGPTVARWCFKMTPGDFTQSGRTMTQMMS